MRRILQKPCEERNSTEINVLKQLIKDNDFVAHVPGIALEDYKDIATSLKHAYYSKGATILEFGIARSHSSRNR